MNKNDEINQWNNKIMTNITYNKMKNNVYEK